MDSSTAYFLFFFISAVIFFKPREQQRLPCKTHLFCQERTHMAHRRPHASSISRQAALARLPVAHSLISLRRAHMPVGLRMSTQDKAQAVDADEKKTLHELLWSAAADGNVAAIEALVARGADVNAQQVPNMHLSHTRRRKNCIICGPCFLLRYAVLFSCRRFCCFLRHFYGSSSNLHAPHCDFV
jgi:hypothetical protein